MTQGQWLDQRSEVAAQSSMVGGRAGDCIVRCEVAPAALLCCVVPRPLGVDRLSGSLVPIGLPRLRGMSRGTVCGAALADARRSLPSVPPPRRLAYARARPYKNTLGRHPGARVVKSLFYNELWDLHMPCGTPPQGAGGGIIHRS